MNLINFDKLGLFPNQLVDGDPTECVSLTVTDIVGNILGIPFDADYTYASTLRLLGMTPTTAGLDPFAGMQSAIYYGCLPVSQETFTAFQMGELYIANWQNYSALLQQAATHFTMNGVMTLGVDYQAIVDYLNKTGWGVSIAMRWHENFLSAPNGVLPDPQGSYSNHNVECVGSDSGLIIKAWTGKDSGNGGYFNLTEEVFNKVVFNSYAFDPNGIRWLQILGLLVTRFPALVLTPALVNAQA